MRRWSRRLAPLFINFTGMAGPVRVLDVGCGTGNLSFCLEKNPEIIAVTGLDASAAYVEHANRRNGDPRLDFQEGDACALPFPDASFDHAASMLALQFVPKVDVAVREMRRVTRVGGTIAATTWDTRGGLVALRRIFDAAAMLDQSGREARAAAYTRPMTWGSSTRLARCRPRGCRAGHAHNPNGLCSVCRFLGTLPKAGRGRSPSASEPSTQILGWTSRLDQAGLSGWRA